MSRHTMAIGLNASNTIITLNSKYNSPEILAHIDAMGKAIGDNLPNGCEFTLVVQMSEVPLFCISSVSRETCLDHLREFVRITEAS